MCASKKPSTGRARSLIDSKSIEPDVGKDHSPMKIASEKVMVALSSIVVRKSREEPIQLSRCHRPCFGQWLAVRAIIARLTK